MYRKAHSCVGLCKLLNWEHFKQDGSANVGMGENPTANP